MYIRAKLETKCPKGIKVPSSEIRTFLGSNSLVFGLFFGQKTQILFMCEARHQCYSSNKIRKAQKEHLNIVCQNLNGLVL